MSYVLRLTSSLRAARRSAPTVALALALGLFTCFADVPVSINYVGHLDGVGSSGESKTLTEKNILMVFRLYDVPGTGKTSEKATALWGRQASVSLTDGDFDVDLSDNFGAVIADTKYTSLLEALRATIENHTSDLYLGLTPANDANAEIYPRQKLTAVPKALLAQYVTSVPNDFTVTGGVFSADEIEVSGSAELTAGARYATATIPATTPMTFYGGINAEGTLRAGSTDATDVEAGAVEAGVLETTSSAKVAVTGLLAAVGNPVWNGNLAAAGAALAANTLSGDVSAQTVTADSLTAGTLNMGSTQYLDTKNKSWRIVGAIKEETVPAITHVDNIEFTAWNSYSGKTASRQAILSGVWTAPYDCIAYFQAELNNTTTNANMVGSCLQFYIVDDPEETDFANRMPIGSASADQNMSVKTVVPILVRKGEIVKWLGYNGNENKDVGVKEYNDSKVSAIRCQPFSW